MSFLLEFFRFLRQGKRRWLAPVMVLMLVFGILIVVSQGSVVAPLIYTLF